MKIQFFIFSMLLSLLGVNEINAQIKAVTENGDTIFVYNDGTWSFTEKEASPMDAQLSFLDRELNIDTIQETFKVAESATKEAKNKFDLFKIMYDEKKWDRIPPGKLNNEEAEMAFISKEKDIYSLVIAEEAEIGQENILKIALGMMEKRTGGTVELLNVQQRTVNGTGILSGQFKVDISGMILTFDSYYYSSPKGTVQFTTWAGSSVWEKNQKVVKEFLNGLIIN